MMLKSMNIIVKFSNNFQYFIMLSILFSFVLIPIALAYNTGSSSEESHLFRHRHHRRQHHQQQQQQLQHNTHEPYHYSHRLENVVDEFKKSQNEKYNNITMVNLRHNRAYSIKDVDNRSNDAKALTEESILQFAPLSSDSVLSNNKNHHLRHHNRHHQMWEQRVFPLLRHHQSTTTIIPIIELTTPAPIITTTMDRILPFSNNKLNYLNKFDNRQTDDSNGIDDTNSDYNYYKSNSTTTKRFFDHDGVFYSWKSIATRKPITKRWQSFNDKHSVEPSLRTFSDDNRFYSSNNDDVNISDLTEYNNGDTGNRKDENKDSIKKKQLHIQKGKKKKSNLLNKNTNFKNMKNINEYYDDDDDSEESESLVKEDYNSEENNEDDDLNVWNESRNYVELKTLPKTKTFTMNSDDIYSRSYKPGTLTEQKFEMLGTHDAVKQSRKLHITNQRHQKALATAHITKVTKDAACSIPKPRVERIQRETSKLYVPHCTILHRCGDDTGCCLSDSKTCVAKKTQDVTLYFFVKSMNSNQGTIERLTFKNHTECHCEQKSKHGTNNINLMMEPAMLREATVFDCNCPKLFEKVLQNDGYCRCDCSSGNSNCDWLKRGMEHFSMTDRKCIIEGRCKLPTCEFGSYVKKHGRCPKKDDKLSSYSKSLH